MGGPKKTFLSFVIDPELLERIEDVRFKYRCSTRGVAIRKVLLAGLQVIEQQKPEQQKPEQQKPEVSK